MTASGGFATRRLPPAVCGDRTFGTRPVLARTASIAISITQYRRRVRLARRHLGDGRYLFMIGVSMMAISSYTDQWVLVPTIYRLIDASRWMISHRLGS